MVAPDPKLDTPCTALVLGLMLGSAQRGPHESNIATLEARAQGCVWLVRIAVTATPRTAATTEARARGCAGQG